MGHFLSFIVFQGTFQVEEIVMVLHVVVFIVIITAIILPQWLLYVFVLQE